MLLTGETGCRGKWKISILSSQFFHTIFSILNYSKNSVFKKYPNLNILKQQRFNSCVSISVHLELTPYTASFRALVLGAST